MNKNLKKELLTKKINKAVSFNAIKNMAFELFFNEKDYSVMNEKLIKIFKENMTVQRSRTSPRDEISVRKAYNFQRRSKKHVY